MKHKKALCIKLFRKTILPYFCKNSINGSETQIKRIVLVVILHLYRCADFCCGNALALANAHYTVCNYVFCAGAGYHLTADFIDSVD